MKTVQRGNGEWKWMLYTGTGWHLNVVFVVWNIFFVVASILSMCPFELIGRVVDLYLSSIAHHTSQQLFTQIHEWRMMETNYEVISLQCTGSGTKWMHCENERATNEMRYEKKEKKNVLKILFDLFCLRHMPSGISVNVSSNVRSAVFDSC